MASDGVPAVSGADEFHEGSAPPPLDKPSELLAVHAISAELFETLKRWFAVPDHVGLDLAAPDSAVGELGDPLMIAAMAMRKLQALHLIATPGVVTTTDIVATIVGDLDRALVQAPSMRLEVQAETADWDAAFAELDAGGEVDAPEGTEAADPEVERFHLLHGGLHEAVRAVLEASDGMIRRFI